MPRRLALLPLLVFAASFAALRAAQRALTRPFARQRRSAASAALIGLFAVQQMAPQALGPRRPVSDHASATLLSSNGVRPRSALAGMAAFEGAIAQDRFRTVPADRLLARLGGADVLLMFVESYGRSALELPRYARTLAADARSLRRAPRRARPPRRLRLAHLADRGRPVVAGARHAGERPVASRSGALRGAAAQSERLTLTRAFARAGYRTVALKPAITRPWPEGERLGFAQIYAAADLGYAGKPYNWVTMPDQYTLAALERAERAGAERPCSPKSR